MKKLIIFLLFLGLSLGQDKGLSGIWNCKTCPENYKYTFVLKEDNSGYISIGEVGEVVTEEIFWEKIVDKKDDFKEEGVFILKYTSGSSDMDKYIFYNKPLEVFHDIFSEMSKPHSKYDSGDILILTFDNNKFHMFER